MIGKQGALADDAQLVLHFTRDEASRLNDPRISPDHLAFALARARDTPAGQLLAAEGADLGLARETVEYERRRQRLGLERKLEPWTPPGFTSALRQVLQEAADLAVELGHEQVRSEHLLLACLAHNGGHGVAAFFRMRLYTPAWDRIWTAALDRLEVPGERRPTRPTPDYRPPPTWLQRERLRGVTPVAQILERGDHQLVILSLEEYSDGFQLRCDYTLSAAPPNFEMDPAEFSQPLVPPRLRAQRLSHPARPYLSFQRTTTWRVNMLERRGQAAVGAVAEQTPGARNSIMASCLPSTHRLQACFWPFRKSAGSGNPSIGITKNRFELILSAGPSKSLSLCGSA